MSAPKSLRQSLPGFLRILRRFWPQIRHQLALLGVALVALLAEIGLRLLEPWPLKFVIDRVAASDAQSGVIGIPWLNALDPAAMLVSIALAVVVIAGLRACAAYLSTVSMALAGNRILTEVRILLYQHLLRLSLSFHTRARSGDLITRLTGDVGRLQEVAVTAVLPLLIHSLTLLGMLVLMFLLNWRLALLALAAFPLLSLSMLRLSGRIQGVAREQRRREGVLAASAAEALGAIMVVKAFSLEHTLEEAFGNQSRKSFKEGIRGKRLSARLERTVDVLIAAGTALVLWYGGWLALGGFLTPGDLLVFLSYLKGAFRPTRDLAKYSGRVAKATAAGERVLDLLDATPDIRDRPDARSAPVFRGEVHFQAVTFAYEPGRVVLDGVSFCACPGQRIALVGPSGSGKSTLVSLLLRLYDPLAGCITIDGWDLRKVTLHSLRSQASVVLQESVLFATSVRDNIAYGRPGATTAEIEVAARLANAHDFIVTLPQGYDTLLGERGATLSGGQRQRIAIARAAVRRAPLVILDEPATGLDSENARIVRDALNRLVQGCTTFLIAHDLRSAQDADLILYLERGRVLERGTHNQLLAMNGRYAAMATRQIEAAKDSDRQEAFFALTS
jgi:ATP-binding cassette subfamily B protein